MLRPVILSIAVTLLLCTPALADDTCRFTILNGDASRLVSFDLTGLDYLFPTLFANEIATDWSFPRSFYFSVCGNVAPPAEFASVCAHSDTTNAAAYQVDSSDPYYPTCFVAGRTVPSVTESLYIEEEYAALGPLGLSLRFVGGDGNTGPDGDCPDSGSSRSFQVNLRCPYFLNGYAPDPLEPQTQPNTTYTAPLMLTAPTRVPAVGYVRERVPNSCDYVVDIDTVYGCPLECLPPDFGITKTTEHSETIELCTNRGICGNITSQSMGCMCDQDRTGEFCQTPGSFTINSTNAKTPMAVVSGLLLVAVLVLTVALFRKMRYLHKEEGNLYGNLQLSTNDSSAPAL